MPNGGGTPADYAMDAADTARRKAEQNADRITRLARLLVSTGCITQGEFEVWEGGN